MNEKHQKALVAAVLKLLRPLARILLRNGVSFSTFSDAAKWIYVDVATKEFRIEGRKQSTSRVSVITGLSRRGIALWHKNIVMLPDRNFVGGRFLKYVDIIEPEL